MNEHDIETREKQEVTQAEGCERMRPRRVFAPATDIYETEEAVYLTADMPGVQESEIDITLEKKTLTLRATAHPQAPEGMTPLFHEYADGDYERAFVLSEEIDREGIEANMRDGVLHLTLPKRKDAQSRKIKVSAAS